MSEDVERPPPGGEVERTDSPEEVEGEPVADPTTREAIAVVSEFIEEYRGPTPSPRHLRESEEVLPGSADRLIGLTERQSAHRQEMERTLVAADVTLRTRGQMFAFVIAMTAIIAGAVLIAMGENIAGLVALLAGLGPVVAAYAWSQRAHQIPSGPPPPEAEADDQGDGGENS